MFRIRPDLIILMIDRRHLLGTTFRRQLLRLYSSTIEVNLSSEYLVLTRNDPQLTNRFRAEIVFIRWALVSVEKP